MPYIITRANENNKVGKMGKGRKISHIQTIVVGGDERNKCRPVYRVTIIHKNNIGIGATPVLPYSKPEPEQARGAALSAIRPMTVAEYNNIHANDYKTERNTGSIILIMIVATICLIKHKSQARIEDTGSVILIMIVVIICLISVIRAVKKSN